MLLHLESLFSIFLLSNNQQRMTFFFFCFVFLCTELAELGWLQISSVAGELNGKSAALSGAAQCQPLAAALPLKPRGMIHIMNDHPCMICTD